MRTRMRYTYIDTPLAGFKEWAISRGVYYARSSTTGNMALIARGRVLDKLMDQWRNGLVLW